MQSTISGEKYYFDRGEKIIDIRQRKIEIYESLFILLNTKKIDTYLIFYQSLIVELEIIRRLCINKKRIIRRIR